MDLIVAAAFWAIGFISGITVMIGIWVRLPKDMDHNRVLPSLLPKKRAQSIRPVWNSESKIAEKERDGKV